MHGDGLEIRQVFLFHVFVCIFGLDGAQNTPFFRAGNQSNLLIKLCITNLRTYQKAKNCHSRFNIDCDNIPLALEF